jgi:hypothetical protein
MIEVSVSKALLKELELATEMILREYKLAGTDLYRSIEYKFKDNKFVMLANDYFEYVAFGRKPRARKVPVEDLIKWMKRKGINPKRGDYNATAFAIQQAIYKNGIKARPYINPIIQTDVDIISEDLAYELSEEIALVIVEDIEKFNR